jgi:hypothetical protein
MFTQSDIAFLKKTMIPRAPACFFSPDDMELCINQTKNDKPAIKNWEKCLRFRMSHRSPTEIEEYLKASPESLDGKVMCLKCPLSTNAIEITLK